MLHSENWKFLLKNHVKSRQWKSSKAHQNLSKRKMNAENEKLLRGKLFAAAWRGDFDGVKTILENGSNKIDIDSTDENGVTALRFTSQFGHYEITE